MRGRTKDPYLTEEWQRLFMEQRSHMARAGIHAALLLNGGAAVALLAFLGHLAGASEHAAYRVDFNLVRYAFGTFGGGVFLATVTYLFMYQISSLRIHDHLLDKRFPARTIDTIRWVAVVLFVFALLSFLLGMVFAVLSVQAK